jgi:hypothetical protein
MITAALGSFALILAAMVFAPSPGSRSMREARKPEIAREARNGVSTERLTAPMRNA